MPGKRCALDPGRKFLHTLEGQEFAKIDIRLTGIDGLPGQPRYQFCKIVERNIRSHTDNGIGQQRCRCNRYGATGAFEFGIANLVVFCVLERQFELVTAQGINALSRVRRTFKLAEVPWTPGMIED